MASATSFSIRFLLPSLLVHGFCFAMLFFFNANQLIKAPFGSESIAVDMFVPVDSSEKSVKSTVIANDNQEKAAVINAEKKIASVQAQSVGASVSTGSQIGTADGDQSASEKARYLFGLRKLIESRKVYPAQARRNGETGKVVIGLLVHRDGGIENFKIKQASASARLNQAALDAVSSVKRYDPFPEGISSASLEIDVTIEYAL